MIDHRMVLPTRNVPILHQTAVQWLLLQSVAVIRITYVLKQSDEIFRIVNSHFPKFAL